jgi:hypothetical protein
LELLNSTRCLAVPERGRLPVEAWVRSSTLAGANACGSLVVTNFIEREFKYSVWERH